MTKSEMIDVLRGVNEMLDGYGAYDPYDMHRDTGIPEDRCAELAALYGKLGAVISELEKEDQGAARYRFIRAECARYC